MAYKKFTDGRSNYAYMGGPLVSVIVNLGWLRAYPNSTPYYSLGRIFGHETAHIFWARDEYSLSGENSAPLNYGPRPNIPNGNFEDATDHPVQCVMRSQPVEYLCSFAAAKIGWIDAPHFTHLNTQPEGFPIIVPYVGNGQYMTPVAFPWAYGQKIKIGAREIWSLNGREYRFQNWSDGRTVQGFIYQVRGNDTLKTAIYYPTGLESPWQNYLVSNAGLPSSILWDVFFDADSNLWVCGMNGVARLDQGQWVKFTPQEGFPDDYVYSLTLDPDDRIWAGGDQGISC